jgi:hypothetical protein
MGIEKHNFRKSESDLFSLRGLESNYQVEAAGEIPFFRADIEDFQRSSGTQRVSERMIIGFSVCFGQKRTSRSFGPIDRSGPRS